MCLESEIKIFKIFFFFTYANFKKYIFSISEAHHVPEHTLRGPRKYIFSLMKFVSISEIY